MCFDSLGNYLKSCRLARIKAEGDFFFLVVLVLLWLRFLACPESS